MLGGMHTRTECDHLQLCEVALFAGGEEEKSPEVQFIEQTEKARGGAKGRPFVPGGTLYGGGISDST